MKREFFATPSTEYRSVQAAAIGVDVDHDRVIGRLAYLERTERHLFAVAEIDAASLGEGPWYFSPYIRHRDGRDIELRGLALTQNPASVGLEPVSAFPGTLAEAAREIVYQHGHSGALVKHAREYDRQRKHGEPIVIQGTHPQPRTPGLERATSTRPIEIRSAAAVEVHRARRKLDLIIAPAETPTVIYERSRRYTETFSHGAFTGCETNPGRVKVNRDHQHEALALIDDDLLGVSAGFAIASGGDEWRGTHRRVRRALIHHIALVPEPAHQAARVTAVRGRELLSH